MLTIAENEIIKNWNSHDIPLVSIKCLTYNHEKYISQALDGFLMQKTNFPFEIVVHDDASTDKTAEKIREYEKKYPNIIKPIYELENQYSKPGISINDIILPYLRGKYIAICEGDDYWIDENKLQMQVDFLENNPEYGMCFHNAIIQNELSQKNDFNYNVNESREYTPTELFSSWIVPTASIVYKKKMLDFKLKNDMDFLYGDIKLIQLCAHQSRVYGFKMKMSVYRMQPNSVTWNTKKDEERYRKLQKHFRAIKKNFYKIDTRVVNDKIVENYLLCVLKYGNIFEKIVWLCHAFFISPFALWRNVISYFKRIVK